MQAVANVITNRLPEGAGPAGCWATCQGQPVPLGAAGKQSGGAQAGCSGAAVSGEGRLSDWLNIFIADCLDSCSARSGSSHLFVYICTRSYVYIS